MMKTFPIDISGGVNLLDDPRRIAPNEVVKAQNIIPTQPGVYGTRPARAWVSLVAGGNAYPVSAKFVPWANGPAALVTVVDATLTTTLLLGDVFNLSAPTTTQTFPEPVYRPWMAPFLQKLYVLTGLTSAPVAYEVSRNPTTGNPVIADFNFSGTGNETARPRLAIAYRNRFVYAHFGPGFENTLVFSDNFVPGTVGNDVLAVNGRNVSLVAAGDGEEIVAIHQVAIEQVTTPTQMALLVLRNNSAFLLTGEPDQTTGGTNTLASNRININVGCLSPWGIVSTPYGHIWADSQDVWLMATGTVPRPIGAKIREALQRVPANLAYRVTAAYHDGFYRLMLYGVGQGPTDFDALQDQWWLDLRHGAPRSSEEARWWGPQQFVSEKQQPGALGTLVETETGSRVFLAETRPRAIQVLYGVEIGRSGSGFRPQVVQYDIPNERDNSVEIPPEQLESEVVGTEVQIELLTREYDFDDPRNPGLFAPLEKSFDGMDFAMWVSRNGRFQLDVIANGGETTTSVDVDVTAAGFEGDVSQLDGGTVYRKPQPVAATLQPDRPVGTTFQMRIRNEPGIVITDSNDVLTVIEDPQGAAQVRSISVPQGFYADVAAYLTALQTAFNDALVSTWVLAYDNTTGLTDFSGAGPSGIGIQLAGDSWSYATTDQATENRRILALLGVDPSVDITGGVFLPGVLTFAGNVPVYRKTNAIWEFSGLSATAEIFRRRP